MPQIAAGANDAFSQALARSFFVTLIAGSVAFLLSLTLRDSWLPEGIQLSPEPLRLRRVTAGSQIPGTRRIQEDIACNWSRSQRLRRFTRSRPQRSGKTYVVLHV